MKRISLTQKTNCFLLIFLCFLWTSSGYLSWLYRLMEFTSGVWVELLTEVVGYLFQALGLLLFALIVRRCPKAAGRVPFSAVVGADFLMVVLSVLSRGLTAALLFGYCMNTLHGVVAGYYLYRLASVVQWQGRALVFGAGYALASIVSWLLSLWGGANFLRSPYVLLVYGVLAALTVFLIVRQKEVPLQDIRFDGEKPSLRLAALAGATVFLLSLVKNLGFSFPSADVAQGISLELSRVFYAAGLVVAGIVGDRERKYGAICCVASLGVPFLMIALSENPGPSYVFWVLNYLLFGFFAVFRVILFSDIARKDASLLYLSGFGLLFGRLGDAAGTYGCISLSGHTVALVSSAAVLFAVTILAFFLLYQRVYLPAPIQARSEQERFDSFAAQYELSSREREILRLVLTGQSNPEMAANLYISESTVKFHIHNLLKKTGCENRVSLVALYRST
ncbi:helix-turn-helix transcriptional regulator [Oscillibacter valericigenes]|uniref:helix-turn-helix transcriptional regulator n=1 Tax=Oscillibacter valericigenes TaxID=351091 RepID=UPI001F3010B0|nr:helix-turn-helix transcriptional regulator [Oscillibacter valericigenes]